MEVPPPENPIVWGIQMSLQPREDKVTPMLGGEAWEDDATATTTASTAEPDNMLDEISDGESTAEPVDEENAYREPPSEPMYNGKGASPKPGDKERRDVARVIPKVTRAAQKRKREEGRQPKRAKQKRPQQKKTEGNPAQGATGTTLQLPSWNPTCSRPERPRQGTEAPTRGRPPAVGAKESWGRPPAAMAKDPQQLIGNQTHKNLGVPHRHKPSRNQVPRDLGVRWPPAELPAGQTKGKPQQPTGHPVPKRAGTPRQPTRHPTALQEGRPRQGTEPKGTRGLAAKGRKKPHPKDTEKVNDAPPRHWTRLQSESDPEEVAEARRRLAEEIMGEAATQPMTIRGLVCPRWRAKIHPAAPLLREYARQGCPVSVGRNWTAAELQAAVDRGPHASALKPDAIEQIQLEAREKVNQGFAEIYKWEDLKARLNEHPNLKLSPLAMIPHKSRKYRAILDLSFSLEVDGYALPSVNDASKSCAPEEAIDQIGTVLPRIIEALATADPSKGDIRFSKLDIKDGFWRMVCREGEEWNFAYILPNHEGEPVEVVVPSALQMGWALSPPFFCAASETARDVAASFAREPVGALPKHPKEELTLPEALGLQNAWEAGEAQGASFLHMLEVYVDDFIQLAQSSNPDVLRHCSRAALHGIHSVFPPPIITGHRGEDPISQKKLMEGEGVWEVRKEILGWVMDGATRCIELAQKKREAILSDLKMILRKKNGVPFKKLQQIVGKLRHASIGVPAGRYLFGPVNQLMSLEPKMVYWNRAPAARQALKDWGQLIRESTKEPTHVNELVTGEAAYKGTLDASGEGAGGVWLPGTKAIAPTVWRVEWPAEVKERLVTGANPKGDITNSDLEMAAEVLGWLVLEAIVPTRHEHVGVCSDNSATVAWQMRGASKRSAVANRLLRVLATRLRVNRASPLVTRHLTGERNHLGDIPSRSFGYKAEWHHVSDDAFLSFFNKTFPLPQQNTWTGFRLRRGVATKVTRELLMQGSSMAEWRQLSRLGRKYGRPGRPTANLTRSLRTWTQVILKK